MRVLHLVGSPSSEEMAELSRLYARGCAQALPDVDFLTVHVAPDGSWTLPRSPALEHVEAAEDLTMIEALSRIVELGPAVGLPQMFCRPGMTSYRALLDLLGLPMIGNPPLPMGLTADKWLARTAVAATGVNVPHGVLVSQETEPPTADLPAIVKPARADNSDGVTLVRDRTDLQAALEAAFHFGGHAIIETFIPPGRELRCGVIEWNGELLCLPPEEYPVNGHTRPIRTKNDKIGRASDGAMKLEAKTRDAAWMVDADDPAVSALHAAARRCYRALGCRQYGLFDFRVDDEGRPWFLEAGLYCSFSPQSVVVMMAEAAGIPLAQLFDAMARDAIASPSG